MNIDYIRDNYMTAPQAAEYLGITRNRVGRLCLEGRFNGAGKIGDTWLIPRESVESHKRLKPGGLSVEKVIAQYEHNSNLHKCLSEQENDYNFENWGAKSDEQMTDDELVNEIMLLEIEVENAENAHDEKKANDISKRLNKLRDIQFSRF